MAVLRLVPLKGDPILVDTAEAVVGREPSCNVVVSHPSVSRRHAMLRRADDVFSVEDEGSANGTFLNSDRVSSVVTLKPGDALRFGSATFAVELIGSSEMLAVDEEELVPARTNFAAQESFSETILGEEAPSIEPAEIPTAPFPALQKPPSQPIPPPPPPPQPRPAVRPQAPAPVAAAAILEPAPTDNRAVAPPAGSQPQTQRSPLFWAGIGGLGCLAVALIVGSIAFAVLFFVRK